MKDHIAGEKTICTCSSLVQSVLDNTFTLSVESRGGLIEQENTRIGDDSTSDGNTLLLATREQETTFTDHSLITERELGDESIGVGLDTSFLDEVHLLIIRGVFERCVDQTVSDVLPDSGSEQGGFLRDETDL